MKHSAGLVHAQQHRLSMVTMQCISLLPMSNGELNAHIARVAAENPFVEPPERVPVFSAALPCPATEPTQSPDGAGGPSLYAHLAPQICLLLSDPVDRQIAQALLAELDGCGWLGAPLSDIAASCGHTEARVQQVLHMLQRCEPTGVFARDLRECLLLQARECDLLTPAMTRILNNLPLLGERLAPNRLARQLDLDEATLMHTLAMLRRLDPKPGARFQVDPTIARNPDAIVRADGKDLVVELNQSSRPSVTVGNIAELQRGSNPELSRLKREAQELRAAVRQRNDTTLLILEALVAAQSAYFRCADGVLQSMTLTALAARAEVHVSTVSRVMNGLILQTPHGVCAARDLIRRAAGSDGQVSPQAMQKALIALIRSEDSRAPMSDSVLQSELAQQGISISRSTVAKYRLDMGIAACRHRIRA